MSASLSVAERAAHAASAAFTAWRSSLGSPSCVSDPAILRSPSANAADLRRRHAETAPIGLRSQPETLPTIAVATDPAAALGPPARFQAPTAWSGRPRSAGAMGAERPGAPAARDQAASS